MDYIIKIKRKHINLFKDRWIWKLAWNDAKHNLRRLFLFISSIVIGIAALVSINSFNYSLQEDMDQQARELLGADLAIESDNKKFDESFSAILDTLGSRRASDARFSSMVYFTSNNATRLIQVIAIQGNYPFYGQVETSAGSNLEAFYQGKGAMIDESLSVQFNVHTGDSLKLGKARFPIVGVVTQFPGNTNVGATFAPAVYIPFDALESTGLIQFGSRVNYSRYFVTADAEAVIERLDTQLETFGYDHETVESRKESLGRSFGNLYRFFNLLAFVALVLGAIGVASSVHIYIREKNNSAAVLRCMGASGWQIFYVFFIQITSLGIIGTLIGVGHGLLVQYLLPFIVADFLPVNVHIGFSIWPVLAGLGVGVIMSILFSVLPLSNIRLVAPLSILRAEVEPIKKVSKFRYLIILMIILFPWLFAVRQTGSLMNGTVFFGGLIVTFALLYLLGLLLIKLTRKFFPSQVSFIWRQSLANLFRPNNQTTILVVVIGLGSFLLSMMVLIQNSLLGQVEFVGSGERSNTVLFDIQPSQREGVVSLAASFGLPVQQEVPIVTMRIRSVKGRTVEELQNDTSVHVSRWALTHEYRVTYRDSLISSEELANGTLIKYNPQNDDSVFISVEDRMARRLHIDIGDEIVFDVQGVPITTYVGSFRQVNWQRIQTNFMVVFPSGVLEEAPQFFVIITRVNNKNESAAFQQSLVQQFPNVSAIDLTLILETLDDIFRKVELVIRFMALFSVLTGLFVLAGAVINSKYARLKENVLLRTIGAVRKQIVGMTLIEYSYLGIFAAFTGSLLSILASWLLARFFFEIKFFPDFMSLTVIWAMITLLTVVVGWFNTRSIINNSPLEVLRKEV